MRALQLTNIDAIAVNGTTEPETTVDRPTKRPSTASFQKVIRLRDNFLHFLHFLHFRLVADRSDSLLACSTG